MKVLTIQELSKLNNINHSVNRILDYIPSITISIQILKELDEINNDIEKQKIWLEKYYDFYYETLLIFEVDFNDWANFESETLIKIDKEYLTPKMPFSPLMELFEAYSKLDNEITI